MFEDFVGFGACLEEERDISDDASAVTKYSLGIVEGWRDCVESSRYGHNFDELLSAVTLRS